MDKISDRMRSGVIEAIADHVQYQERKLTVKGALRKAEDQVAVAWQTVEGRRALVPGKDLLRALSKWSDSTFGVRFTPVTVAKALRSDEVDDEIRRVLTAIETRRPISK